MRRRTLTQATFKDAWADLCGRMAKGKLKLPQGTTLPTPADVAGALRETWMADALGAFHERLLRLIDARLGLEPGGLPAGAIRLPPEL